MKTQKTSIILLQTAPMSLSSSRRHRNISVGIHSDESQNSDGKKGEKTPRLESLDILRGFDIFVLVILAPLLWSFSSAIDSEPFHSLMKNCFTHESWQGFLPWDLVMPLFMFMSGITIPFALNKYKSKPYANKWSVYLRLFKRFIFLWVLGMICQGGLLGLNPDKIYLFSNTLQSIAIGYVVAAILFLHCSIRTQIFFAIALLLLYWGLMEFVSVGSFGGGDYTQNGNLAEWIDRSVLGRFRDGASIGEGGVIFNEWYHYTWILSSLNFIVMVLSGSFAGAILKSRSSAQKKWRSLVIIGLILIILGHIMSIWHPISKVIFTSSMTLIGSGYSFILMGIFYYAIDVRAYVKYLNWLKIFGMNSILAYVSSCVLNFSDIVISIFWGTEQYLGDFYSVLITFGSLSILFSLLYVLYKKGIFLKI